MEAENNMDDLLLRYLFNESGAEEQSFVVNWIHANAENRQYFERLKKTLELLDLKAGIEKIDVDKEWKYLQRSISANSLKVVHLNQDELPAIKIEGPVEEATGVSEIAVAGKSKRRWLMAAAAAAVVVGLIAGGAIFFDRNSNVQQAGASPEAVAKTEAVKAVTQHEVNTSGRIKTFDLPDGSVIRLSSNSELTYTEPTGGHQRNVVLKGEAGFAVAKDKTRPFTVFSDDISTMAVGTRFTVTNFENDKFIQVRLDEGKVMIQSERTIDNKLTDKFYLLPGQKLIYDKYQQTAKIKNFGGDKILAGNAVNHDKVAADNPLLPQYNKKSWFMFNNQSLDEIFNELELMYDVKILYSKKDVAQRYFIGTFNKSDAVENILQQIAVLNKLTVTRKDSSFIIEKNR